MTPKEKASELVDKYKPMLTQYGVSDNFAISDAKQCALIAVAEMLDDSVTLSIGCYDSKGVREQWIEYWQEVKQEINKL